MATKRRVIKDIIVESKLVPEDKLHAALEESKKSNVPLQQVIVNMNLVEKTVLLRKISEELGVKAVDLGELEIDPEIVKLVPETSSRRHQAIPFAKEENMLFVVMLDPRDLFAIEDIHLRTGFDILPYLGMPEDITKAIDKAYGTGEVVEQAMANMISQVTESHEEEMSLEKAPKEDEKSDIAEIDASAPEVEKIVNAIILGALQKKASDIHIEPFEKKLLIRYRIDGILIEAPFAPPFSYRNALTAKIKILTEQMNITEHRKPQDGRIQIIAGGKPIEFRVNIIPTVFGESTVMRILDRSAVKVDMDKLGLLPDTLEKLMVCLNKPNGIILVCGPTGSGKSTTLYSCLNAINTPDTKILTAENPVEYNLEGVVQLNVRQELGLDFSAALRAFLRQDPDVIMVGEIRDKETATIAMEAAMTGHLVFSTVHTNDAAGSVARLHEMGVYPFMISSSVECILAQRLLRKICSECKQPLPMDDKHKLIFEQNGIDTKKATLFKGTGCATCNGSGYKGRMGIHELLVFTEEMRSLTLREYATGPIRDLALKQGMRTLLIDGLEKVALGRTTLEEVFRTVA